MVAAEGLTTDFEAVKLVGYVLVEALVLYVGYGVLERVIGPTVKKAVTGE